MRRDGIATARRVRWLRRRVRLVPNSPGGVTEWIRDMLKRAAATACLAARHARGGGSARTVGD